MQTRAQLTDKESEKNVAFLSHYPLYRKLIKVIFSFDIPHL
jgi:hypothetical protein